MLSIGYGQYVLFEEIIVIVASDSAPIKRIIQEAKLNGRLVDATCHKKVRSIVITESSQVILSAFTADSLAKRANDSSSVPRSIMTTAKWINPLFQA